MDSNILIYSADDKYAYLKERFKKPGAAISVISRLEVLGYHKITRKKIDYFQGDF